MTSKKTDFQEVSERVIEDAISRNDEYIRVDYYTLHILQHPYVADPLDERGFQINKMISSLNSHIDSMLQTSRNYSRGGQPANTELTNRTIRLATQLDQLSNSNPEKMMEEIKNSSSAEEREKLLHPNLFTILQAIAEHEPKQCFSSHILKRNGLTIEEIKKIKSEVTKEDMTTQVISEYCTDLNNLAEDGQIDPIIGRDQEILDTIEVLSKRKKANVVFVGAAGVGKTAIAEGLARMISKKKVPDAIKDFRVLSVDLAGMVAGAKYRGEFEERLKKVIEYAKKQPKCVLFFDEIHQMFGAGAGSNAPMDASNIIKPELASGKIRVIGSTTYDEYSSHFRKDSAFSRRFVKIDVSEPSIQHTKEILYGLINHYSDYHDVEYSDVCIEVAVDLADRYMRNLKFPDKAIDIIDAAGARAKLRNQPLVTEADIVAQVSKVSKIPENMIAVEENDSIGTLESRLKNVVFGQDKAIEKLVESIYVAKSGLREPNKPIGNFLFVGPTGVGKTYLSRKLADMTNSKLVKLDMSEYQEKHSISKLIGAPPGYVGYGEGQAGDGVLISKVEENPNSVLLLDEIEKAHKDVYKILLQVMEDGKLTSSNGKTVDFSNVLLIMTSNVGMQDASRNSIGFVAGKNVSAIQTAMKQTFAPEFLNRIDSVIQFGSLTKTEVRLIIESEINKLNELISNKEITVSLNQSTIDHLVEAGYSEEYGARPVARAVTDNIKLPLSRKIIDESLRQCHVRVGYSAKNGFTMTVTNGGSISNNVESVELHEEPS